MSILYNCCTSHSKAQQIQPATQFTKGYLLPITVYHLPFTIIFAMRYALCAMRTMKGETDVFAAAIQKV
jgi:hypothetical protein